MNKTKSILTEMLTENTGTQLMDSGEHKNRNWQINQNMDFESENIVTLTFKSEINYNRSVFHFLHSKLYYSEKLNIELKEFEKENIDLDYFELRENFPYWYAEKYNLEIGGLFGENSPFNVLTCNHVCNLSQDFLLTYFTLDKVESFIALQIHGGCDIRGGYTNPVIFEITDEDILNFSTGYISCNSCENNWHTTDSHNWYPENHKLINLEHYTFKETDKDTKTTETIAKNNINTDSIYIDNNKNGFCPICGNLLEG